MTLTWRGITDATPPAPAPVKPKRSILRLGIVAVLVWFGIIRSRNADGSWAPRPVKRMAGIYGLAIAAWLVGTCGHIVNAGTVTIPITLGKAEEALEPGLHFTLPWPLATTKDVNTQTQNYTMSAAKGEGQQPGFDDSVPILGADGAAANVDATVLYRVAKGQEKELFEKVGLDYQSKIVRPTARTCIRREFTKVATVLAATGKWDDLTQAISDCMRKEIEPVGLILQDFQLRDVTLSAQVQSAIDAKVASQENAARQKFELAAAEQQADITRVVAQATSDAQQILSCGGTIREVERDGATVNVVVPNAADRCQPPQLTPEILQYAYIQALKGLIGSPNNSTLILPTDANLTPLLDLDGNGSATVVTPTPPTTARP